MVLFSLACGAVVATAIQPRKVTNFVITKAARASTSLVYLIDELAQGCPRRGFLEAKLRDYQQYSDETVAVRSMQREVLEFDDAFPWPIQSSVFVRLNVGIWTASLVLKVALGLLRPSQR